MRPVLWFAGNPGRFYSQHTSRAQRVWPQILDRVLKVGQMQLLRKHIAYELNISCKFDSKHLASALQVMNEYVQMFLIWNLHWLEPAQSSALVGGLKLIFWLGMLYNKLSIDILTVLMNKVKLNIIKSNVKILVNGGQFIH